MSTITREKLRELARAKVKSLEFSITHAAFADSRAELEEELELARIALASLEAEAVGEIVLGEYDDCGCHPDARVVCIAADGQADWENFKGGTRLYTAPPATVDKNPLREFAMEYIESWDLGMAGDSSLLASARKAIADSEILQPAPVSVPDALPENDDEEGNDIDYLEPSEIYALGRTTGWNACRAAMLHGADGNSPVIPDGLVMVPVEPTHEMLEAGDEQFGTYDVYRRMIAAAPQQEVK